jgi:hypothetical protein
MPARIVPDEKPGGVRHRAVGALRFRPSFGSQVHERCHAGPKTQKIVTAALAPVTVRPERHLEIPPERLVVVLVIPGCELRTETFRALGIRQLR